MEQWRYHSNGWWSGVRGGRVKGDTRKKISNNWPKVSDVGGGRVKGDTRKNDPKTGLREVTYVVEKWRRGEEWHKGWKSGVIWGKVTQGMERVTCMQSKLVETGMFTISRNFMVHNQSKGNLSYFIIFLSIRKEKNVDISYTYILEPVEF